MRDGLRAYLMFAFAEFGMQKFPRSETPTGSLFSLNDANIPIDEHDKR